ncbi:MAG: 30S ribosome-binding factor RbfA [Elusimicrobiota bacterium]|jgi:ribosome-binding factor A|nr:30S ribosome-binding factor RbfA [Elusimicrobiota bacterium]
MQSYKRSDRVGELIQQTVSLIIRDFKDLNTAVVVITKVKLTDDLLNCKIYFSVFGDSAEKEKNEQILKRNIKEVRHQLALRLNLRRTPTIEFIYDSSNEEAAKVIDLIEKLQNE